MGVKAVKPAGGYYMMPDFEVSMYRQWNNAYNIIHDIMYVWAHSQYFFGIINDIVISKLISSALP